MSSSMFKVDHIGYGTITIHSFMIKPDGRWEKEWEPLRLAAEGHDDLEPILDLVPKVSYHTYQDLRNNWSKPFFDSGVMAPKFCLAKLPQHFKPCKHTDACPSFNPNRCHLDKSRIPPCYDLDAEVPEEALFLLNRLVDLWRMDAYVIAYYTEDETL